MTSYTKALYRRDPAAANEFHRQQQFEHKMTYGKQTQLACFTPAHNPVKRSFGKRAVPPVSLSDCPHNQTFCLDNGLMAWNCTACKNR